MKLPCCFKMFMQYLYSPWFFSQKTLKISCHSFISSLSHLCRTKPLCALWSIILIYSVIWVTWKTGLNYFQQVPGILFNVKGDAEIKIAARSEITILQQVSLGTICGHSWILPSTEFSLQSDNSTSIANYWNQSVRLWTSWNIQDFPDI